MIVLMMKVIFELVIKKQKKNRGREKRAMSRKGKIRSVNFFFYFSLAITLFILSKNGNVSYPHPRKIIR